MLRMNLSINGKNFTVDADDDDSLLSVLREQLQLTGSKYGCGEGACGACTVLINGTPARSCITKVNSLSGKTITTIEGLETNGELHPVQKACLAVDVFQCSYCASGMIMSAVGLLQKNPRPTRDEIVRAMQGNVCRCGTYVRIMKAIQTAINA
jgi:aerobic-type carbon monoxide dehydrogenase small subunit (CoxS/CutS family)